MERTERFYRMEQLLRERRSVPLGVFLETLEISKATFKRDLEYLRDRFKAPIDWDPETRGYRLDPKAPRFELPGLWFSPGEAYALLTMLGVGQDTISRIERRSDMLLSTLRRYVEAMGGRLELVAQFPEREPVVIDHLSMGPRKTAGCAGKK